VSNHAGLCYISLPFQHHSESGRNEHYISGTETLPCNVKRERTFTPIIEYHTSACKHRFSSTQLRLRSEYAYHPRSSPMSPQQLRTKSRSTANYLCRTITTARRTNIRSSLAKTKFMVPFYIHREPPIPLDRARTRKNVVLHINIYNGGTTNRSCITNKAQKKNYKFLKRISVNVAKTTIFQRRLLLMMITRCVQRISRYAWSKLTGKESGNDLEANCREECYDLTAAGIQDLPLVHTGQFNPQFLHLCLLIPQSPNSLIRN
jgi:hypothetical protein